jgi:hypothetical protein
MLRWAEQGGFIDRERLKEGWKSEQRTESRFEVRGSVVLWAKVALTTRDVRGGGAAQWYSTCLACTRA